MCTSRRSWDGSSSVQEFFTLLLRNKARASKHVLMKFANAFDVCLLPPSSRLQDPKMLCNFFEIKSCMVLPQISLDKIEIKFTLSMAKSGVLDQIHTCDQIYLSRLTDASQQKQIQETS